MAAYMRTYGAVNQIKTAVEAICPGVVSCSDIIALAARDATTVSGGFSFPMPTGRRDALVSVPNQDFDHYSIPDPYWDVENLIQAFASRGLDIDDLVVLSGAHSFGISQCGAVQKRLYPTTDTTMNSTYAAALKQVCTADLDLRWYRAGPDVNNNRVTDPNVLSNQYYSNVLTGQVLFKSDQTLMSRNDTAAKVAFYAANPLAWKVRFAAALVKMSKIHVLTGTQGEVRKVCNVVNK